MPVDFYVAPDGGSEGEVKPVVEAIKKEGFTVESQVARADGEALRNQGVVKPPTKLVYIVNGGQAGQTYASFAQNYQEGHCFTIFAFDNYRTHFSTTTEDATKNEPLVSEGDSGSFATDWARQDMKGHTTCTYQQKYPDVFAFVADETSAESLGKRIAHGDYTCGEGDGAIGSGSVVDSGGSAQIKDKTFELCIRRICAATDSIFLVDNNVAILFPYTDWLAFTLRQKINTIYKKEIDPNVFAPEYNNEGFYNKVSIAWGGATLPERFTDDKKETTTSTNTTNFKLEDIVTNMVNMGFRSKYDSKTAKMNKPKSIKTKKGKTTQEISVDDTGATILSEQYDALVEKYGVLEKRVQSKAPDLETAQYIVNALLIQYVRDFNNTCRCRALSNKKYNGGTFHAIQNPFTDETELFYLNGYSVRLKKKEPIYHDLDFRYGPEGAEEIADYQTFGGGGGASNSNDTIGAGSATEEEIWKGTQKACHQWTCGDLRTGESDTNDPQVAEDYYNKNVQAGKKFCLTCFGMSAWLYYQFNYKANIPCRIIGNSDHHVVELFKNNQWYKPEAEYRKYCEKGYRYNDYLKTASPIVLEAPNNVASVGGNTGENK